MAGSHTWSVSESAAVQQLGHFVRARHQAWHSGPPSFEQFERALHQQVLAVERELLAAELARYDVDAAAMEVAGVRYQPVGSDTETYLTAAGEVHGPRHLYRPAGRNAKRYLLNNPG